MTSEIKPISVNTSTALDLYQPKPTPPPSAETLFNLLFDRSYGVSYAEAIFRTSPLDLAPALNKRLEANGTVQILQVANGTFEHTDYFNQTPIGLAIMLEKKPDGEPELKLATWYTNQVSQAPTEAALLRLKRILGKGFEEGWINSGTIITTHSLSRELIEQSDLLTNLFTRFMLNINTAISNFNAAILIKDDREPLLRGFPLSPGVDLDQLANNINATHGNT